MSTLSQSLLTMAAKATHAPGCDASSLSKYLADLADQASALERTAQTLGEALDVRTQAQLEESQARTNATASYLRQLGAMRTEVEQLRRENSLLRIDLARAATSIRELASDAIEEVGLNVIHGGRAA